MLNSINIFKRKHTTLSFEGYKIKCLTIRGREVQAWETVSLAQSDMNQGIIREPKSVGRKVSSLLEKLEASTKNVVTCVTDHRSIHRVITLPAMKKRLLDEAVHRKAKQVFPTPAEETDFSWQIVRETDDEMIVYVLAVPKLVIDQQVKALQAAGIKPKVMDAKPLALMHTIQENRAIILNLEGYSMAVIIVDNHLPAIARTIPVENDQLTPEARLDMLNQELARTTKFYNESHKDRPLPQETPVFVSGELFAAPRLDERLHSEQTLISRLEQNTQYPIRVPAPPLDYPSDLPVAQYVVNLGLALKGTS